jgi:hypothetical protein
MILLLINGCSVINCEPKLTLQGIDLDNLQNVGIESFHPGINCDF